MIAIVDYGMGNVRSLYNALQYIGSDAVVTAEHEEIRHAERVILPGVGAFGDAMTAIRERGLDSALDETVRRGGTPMLGICLGMQLLARSSDEHGIHSGLNWIDATVERFSLPRGWKVPHIGWNEIDFPEDSGLFAGLRPHERNFYFVHSHHVRCRNADNVAATCDYGSRFTAALRLGNVVAVQFHPEKSQDNGIRVLQNFVRWQP